MNGGNTINIFCNDKGNWIHDGVCEKITCPPLSKMNSYMYNCTDENRYDSVCSTSCLSSRVGNTNFNSSEYPVLVLMVSVVTYLQIIRQYLTLNVFLIRGTLSGLRQLFATNSPLKVTKNDFFFTLKALFIVKIFQVLSWIFGHVAKRLE